MRWAATHAACQASTLRLCLYLVGMCHEGVQLAATGEDGSQARPAPRSRQQALPNEDSCLALQRRQKAKRGAASKWPHHMWRTDLLLYQHSTCVEVGPVLLRARLSRPAFHPTHQQLRPSPELPEQLVQGQVQAHSKRALADGNCQPTQRASSQQLPLLHHVKVGLTGSQGCHMCGSKRLQQPAAGGERRPCDVRLCM